MPHEFNATGAGLQPLFAALPISAGFRRRSRGDSEYGNRQVVVSQQGIRRAVFSGGARSTTTGRALS